ncbi:MliC family protein [Robbsia sp. KACC 23696]|uniref:MliC family protein n=1 Tax=Robbsia sp. KACC 23696 TaxID=3149231 RepID=UPI00325A5318
MAARLTRTRRAGALLLALAGASVGVTAAIAAPGADAAVRHSSHPRERRPAPKALTVPQIQVWTQNTIRYVCDGRKSLTVHYSNTKNEQSFALLNVKDRDMLLVNVSAASGSKYVAGQYSWWTKGPQGTLRDDFSGENGTDLLTNCKAQQ